MRGRVTGLRLRAARRILALAAVVLMAGPAAAQWPGLGAPLGVPTPPEQARETAQGPESPQAPADRETRAEPSAPPPPPPPPPENVAEALERWASTAQRAKAALDAGAASTPAFEVLRETLVEQRAKAREMTERAAAAAEPLRAQLEALGPAPAQDDGAQTGESPAVSAERRELRARLDALEERGRQAELARTRADSLTGRIDALIRARFAEELLSLGPSPLNPALWVTAGRAAATTLDAVGEELVSAWRDPVARRDSFSRLPLLGALYLGGAAVLIWARRRATAAIRSRARAAVKISRRAALGAASTAVLLMLPPAALLLIAAAVEQSGVLGPLGRQLGWHLLVGLLLFVGARALGAAFYAPETPMLRLSWVPDSAAGLCARRTRLLGLTLLLYMVFVQGGEAAGLPPGALAVFNLVILAPGTLALWALARVIAPPPRAASPPEAAEGEPEAEPVQQALDSEAASRLAAWAGALAMRLSAVAALGLAATGYYAASQYVFYPLVLSLGVIGVGVMIYSLLRDAVEAYLEGRTGAPGGLRLLPVMAGFVIFLLTLPALAIVWGARRADLAEAWRLIVEGAEIGGARISPAAFLTFAIVFAIGYGLTRLVQTLLAGSVLPNTRLDAGGRSAITTGLGYAGVILAGLIAISAAGLDLSNLAIVAGALSVGIGFGLQAIVNNFVSGIILLVERPVKVGDWILVGGEHGVVKRVAVRATQIETFDKTTLFLPNSELISGKVVNYTHQNNAGRLIIRVTAAYGSDPREVERILTGIARAETRILRYPAPLILFAGFGDNGMLFEMRVILRDVNLIFEIQSDLYFEVEKGLREAGVEIPMAQRAVHLRGGPEGGASAPNAANGSAAPPAAAPRPPASRGEAAGGDPE